MNRYKDDSGYLLLELLILIFVVTLLLNTIGFGIATLSKATANRSIRIKIHNEEARSQFEILLHYIEEN